MRAWAFLLLLACCSRIVAEDFGPIPTRNHRALSLPFLRILPQSTLLQAGERRLDFSLSIANEARLRGVVGNFTEEDYEMTRIALRYRQGLDPKTELLVIAPYMIRSGGFLDPIVDRLHYFIFSGWNEPYRESQPHGRTVINLPGASYGAATGVGDVTLQAARSIGAGAIALVAVEIPIGDHRSLLGSGSLDFGAALATERPIGGQWRLHAQAGAVLQGPIPGGPRSRRVVEQLSWALIWNPNTRDAWVLQWQHEASALITGAPGSDGPHRSLTLAWQRRVGEGQMLELKFTQDNDVIARSVPLLVHIAPDVTLGVRWSRRL
jgi:hypothetical protein